MMHQYYKLDKSRLFAPRVAEAATLPLILLRRNLVSKLFPFQLPSTLSFKYW